MFPSKDEVEEHRRWWQYHADFFTFPLVVVAVFIGDFDRLTAAPLHWGAAFALGFVAWTFAEYWVHRSVLHGFYWHGTHEHHHDHPKEHVLFPLWYVPGLFVVIFALAYLLSFAWQWAFAAFGGFTLGYVWFTVMHHWLHHVDLKHRTWLWYYSVWHDRHHKASSCNFGITTNFWDKVFGTSR